MTEINVDRKTIYYLSQKKEVFLITNIRKKFKRPKLFRNVFKKLLQSIRTFKLLFLNSNSFNISVISVRNQALESSDRLEKAEIVIQKKKVTASLFLNQNSL